MLPEIKSEIDKEISYHCALIGDPDSKEVDTYRREFYRQNETTTDVRLLKRPNMPLVSHRIVTLRNLRALYYSKKFRLLSDAVRNEMHLPPDPITYAILEAMRDSA